MWTALSGLTTRGRSFLASGLASVVCSYFIVGAALLRVGVLLTAVPIVAALLVSRTRYRIRAQRSVAPSRVPAGGEAKVRLELDNLSRVPTGILLIEDRLPYVLGARPRFVLDRVGGSGHRTVAYRIRSDVRGRFPLGPLSLRLADPFGMCEIDRSYTTHDTLTVTPIVHQLPPIRLSGEWSGTGDGRGAAAAAGEDDIGVREYRHGDDVRRVHWRATAHRGELMVRREEQPLQRRATVVLDTRGGAHAGEGPGSSFEWAVSAVASMAIHLRRQGYTVRVLADSGEDLLPPGRRRGDVEFETAVLDGLAVVTQGAPSAARADGALREAAGGLVFAVFGALSRAQVAAVAPLRGDAVAVAFVLDLAAWVPEADEAGVQQRQEAETLLRQAGWRVVTVRPSVPLASLWRLVAPGSGTDGGPAAGPGTAAGGAAPGTPGPAGAPGPSEWTAPAAARPGRRPAAAGPPPQRAPSHTGAPWPSAAQPAPGHTGTVRTGAPARGAPPPGAVPPGAIPHAAPPVRGHGPPG